MPSTSASAHRTDGIWERIGNESLVRHRIAAQIEKVVTEEHLRPGERLPPERQLATLLGVSRPSLREALKTLEAAGRIEVRHGRGAYVAKPDRKGELRRLLAVKVGVSELFAMREVLEVPAAGWAATASPDALAAVSRRLEALNAASMQPAPDFRELQTLDAEFHLSIANAAGNPFLTMAMGLLQDMLATSMEATHAIPHRLERSRAEHRRLVDAILSGDPSDARRAMRVHLRAVQVAAVRAIQEGTRGGSDSRHAGAP